MTLEHEPERQSKVTRQDLEELRAERASLETTPYAQIADQDKLGKLNQEIQRVQSELPELPSL